MKEKIIDYFKNFDFDIRKTNSARFIDQKVTPDVLSIISDIILMHKKECFTSKDIREFEYSNEAIKDIFGKPDIKKAQNEYDKFFAQPLKLLAYAQILSEEKKGNRYEYCIKNKEILEFISLKERNAIIFLEIYLEKVLKDSDLFREFEKFFNNQTKENLYSLKHLFQDFILQNTPITKKLEINRIFPKILNLLAYRKKTKGTIKGNLSKDIIGLDDLMYNRKNFRDLTKRKNETREEFEERLNIQKLQKEAYTKYSIDKAKRIVYNLHYPNSEIQDEFAIGEATQVHHIFMKSQYPKISSFLENLILLTATQHYTKAHPNNNTQIIDKDYQLLSLLAKSKSIEKYIDIYSKEDFLYVLEVGLNKSFDKNLEFDKIREKLIEIYNKE